VLPAFDNADPDIDPDIDAKPDANADDATGIHLGGGSRTRRQRERCGADVTGRVLFDHLPDAERDQQHGGRPRLEDGRRERHGVLDVDDRRPHGAR